MSDPVRDYSILRAVAKALDDTGQFSRVVVGEKPTAERTGVAANATPAAIVTPVSFDETDNWDDPTEVQSERVLQIAVTLIVRDESEDTRIDLLDRLGQEAAKAIGGLSLAGVTIPDKTRVRRGQWSPAADPEKQLVLTVETSYLIDGFDGYDTAEYQE